MEIFIPQYFGKVTDDLLFQVLLELRQIRINTTPAVPVGGGGGGGGAVANTRIYFGYDDVAPTTTAQIQASPHFIDVATGSDYNIDFTPNVDAKICWFAENVGQQAKTEVYMTPLNNFIIGVDQTIEGFTIVDNLRLYQTAFKTLFTDISQIKKTV